MNIRRIGIVFGLAAATAVALRLALASPAAAAKTARAERYDVAVTVQTDGSVVVTETVVFVYAGGPFTYVTRDIPAERTDGLTDFAAYMDGALLPAGDQPGQVEIAGRDPVHITWHFAPTSDAAHEFTLTYRALGVVQKTAAADVLTWQALPDEYDYTIASSTVTVTYPRTAALAAVPAFEGLDAAVETGPGRVIVTAQSLEPDTTLIVDLRFAPGSVTPLTPAWQARQAEYARRTWAYGPALLGLAGLALAGGGALAYGAWRRGQPAPALDSGPRATPPGDLPPALVGALNTSAAEPATTAALGTLFDLARRGVVAIEQHEKGNWIRTQKFAVTLLARPAGLRPHELALVEQLFGAEAAPGASAPLTERMQKLMGRWRTFAEPVKAELRQAGWLDEERQRQRGVWTTGGFLLMIGGLGLLMGAALLNRALGAAVFALPGAVFLLGLFVVILGQQISPLTDSGREAAAGWKQFGHYLTQVTRGREAVTRPDLFERYLAYAAGLGLAEGWLKYFRKHGEAAIPAWFQPLADDGGASFAALIAATSASTGGAAGAAGAGAAGGGASGTG